MIKGSMTACFSLPVVVDRRGIEKVLRLALGPAEMDQLRRSTEILQDTIKSLELDGIIN
jgi:malate/lactate dehydrogenase